MNRRIFGLENYFAAVCVQIAFRRVVTWGRSSNVFLENGARLYLDVGSHPEYATPECDSIEELVACDKAGERILEGLAAAAQTRMEQEGIHAKVYLLKNNTDSQGNSYGCHENYLLSRRDDFSHVVQVLIPFLVSRPIINTRDEPHADAERFRRLHVIVGDSNMSEYATFLKVGATGILLRMLEDPSVVIRDMTLEDPIRAIREISHDISCRHVVRLANGRELSALDIQREYLERALRYHDLRGLPGPEEKALAMWVHCMEGLERDPLSLGRECDWVAKYQLVEEYRARHNLPLEHPRVALLDLQYHDVNTEHGIFYLLQARGRMERIVKDRAIARAMNLPPSTTRARLRGEFIRRAKEKDRDFTVDWVHLKLNDQTQRTVLLKDPLRSHDERVERLIDSI